MKAFHFFRLAALTGMAALGQLSAEVTLAQAPSGPITAAPAQPAAVPGIAPKPVAAPTPRTTILGAWKLNLDDSDDPSKRRQDSQDSNGGRGPMGGGDSGRGHGGLGGEPGGGEGEEERGE